MKVNIATFKCLDGIAARREIQDIPWATASKIRRPSISEMRRIERHPNEKIGRSCTIDKIQLLFNGLYKILGGDALRKDMLDCIEKEPDQDVRFLLYSLILKDSTKEARDAVESTMKIAVKSTDKK